MSATVTPLPTLGETNAVLTRINATRARVAALAIRPPNDVDPRNVDIVRDAARQAAADQRGGIDIKA